MKDLAHYWWRGGGGLVLVLCMWEAVLNAWEAKIKLLKIERPHCREQITDFPRNE